MITDIIFDWGGVLALADNPHAAKIIAISSKYGYAEEEFVKWIGKSEDLFSTTPNSDEYFEKVNEKFHVNKKELTDALNSAHATEVLQIAKKVKQAGYRVHLLSNQMAFRTKYIRSHNDLTFFDNLFFSNEVGLMKPQKEFYQYALKKIGAKPENCLFIDDKEKNVEAAKKLGINSFQFKNKEQMLKQLKRYGIQIKGNV